MERGLLRLGKSSKVHLEAETFSKEAARAALGQADLFGGERPALVLDQTLVLPEAKEFLEEEGAALVAAATAVFVLEESLPATLRKSLEGVGAEIVILEREPERRGPSVFALAEALGRRDKKNLWVLYRKFLKEVEPEEIVGILFWQLKIMKLVLAGEISALNPYVVSKARSFLKNYQREEIDQKLFLLTDLYHRGHRGEEELALGLERFMLSL